MVHLTENERRTLWEALAAARLFYQEKGLKEQEAKVWDMLRLVSYAHGIGLDITTKNMTEIGLNEYKELMRKREEKQEETGQVIRFPGT
jgi:hypothetical protein